MRAAWSLALLLLAASNTTIAQTSASAPAATSPAKKDLVQKILVAQQPGIEAMAQQLAQQPAELLLQRAGAALQRVPAEKRDALARDIRADAKKYADEAVPIVRDRALKLAPTTIGTLLEEKFTEEELRQVLAILESPVNRKFQALGVEMQRSLGEKLVADTRAAVEPKVQALERTIAGRLGAVPAPGAGASAAPAKK